MPTMYMIIWSMVIIVFLSMSRVRQWRQVLVLVLVTAVTLTLSDALFLQLSHVAGINPQNVVDVTGTYLAHGPIAWLALLIMPCGWLGPVIGLNILRRSDNASMLGAN